MVLVIKDNRMLFFSVLVYLIHLAHFIPFFAFFFPIYSNPLPTEIKRNIVDLSELIDSSRSYLMVCLLII